MTTLSFTPYEKLSKKQKKQLNAQRRSDWGSINPTTCRTDSKKLYNRKKNRRDWSDSDSAVFHLCNFQF